MSHFSTLKAGRDAAAFSSWTIGLTMADISVPSKRVETLPRPNGLPAQPADYVFQYPQSGSRRCRPRSFPGRYSGRTVISVPSKRVETLPRADPHFTYRMYTRISVPSKRVETLPHVAQCKFSLCPPIFQYPQSGSRRCRLAAFG